MEFQITDNGSEGEIAVQVDGNKAGYIRFRYMDNGSLNALSTLVFDAYRDQKLGMPLLDKLVAYAADRHVRVYPTCPFVVKMFSRKPEWHYLLDEGFTFPGA